MKIGIVLFGILCTVLLYSTPLCAQSDYEHFLRDPNAITGFEKGQGYLVKDPPSSNKIKGSPFLFNENWHNARVRLRTGETRIESGMRYNIHTNEMQYRVDNTIYALNGSIVDTIYMNNCVFVFIQHQDVPQTNSYYRLLKSSPHKAALVHYSTSIKTESYNPALNVGEDVQTIVQKEKRYILLNGRMVSINSKADLSQLFSKEDMRKFKLSFRTNDDLLQVFDALKD
ncbi:MAG: hypothetical protein EAZ67_10655 [Cytophagales bacterium]|nr:MAG: hypothetical protein EAZ67_10655 [Cytophagales bacterium]